jgi:tetratricopeptide (TPR) repeat protein
VRRPDSATLGKMATDLATQRLPPAVVCSRAADLSSLKEWTAAERLLKAAQVRDPGDFWLNYDLGMVIEKQGPTRAEEAIRYLQAALALRTDSPAAYLSLALTLEDKGDVEGAILCCKAALDINPKDGHAHNNLGVLLMNRGDVDGAIVCYKRAIEIDPKDAYAQNNLGYVLRSKGNVDEAIACFKKAIDIDPKYDHPYSNLTAALMSMGKLDEAIPYLRRAIAMDPKMAKGYSALGLALQARGELEEATACYRRAIEIDPKDTFAHYNLGSALRLRKDLDGAIAAYHKAIDLDRGLAEAHCNLGQALKDQGRFAEALEELRRGDALGRRRPDWRYPSAHWVRKAEELVALEAKLPKLLKGEAQPADTGERLQLATLCVQPYKQLYAAAIRWYAEAFAADPHMAADLKAGHRYNAACAAALAGCGQGKDVDKLGAKERSRLRQQALGYLRDDLKAYRQVLDKSPDKAGPEVAHQMQNWLQDPDFAGVRGADGLARLPEAERPPWQELWEEVEALRRRAAEKPGAARPARP